MSASRDDLNRALSVAYDEIDKLTAEIERLKGGQGDQLDVAVTALNDIAKVSRMGEKPFEIATLAIGEMSPIASQPAPVVVVLPERLTTAELEELEVIEVLLHGQGLSNLAGTMAAARQFIDEVVCERRSPLPVTLPSREVMRDLIAEVIGSDTYDCVRVWSAWGVGTMSEDDFVPLIESEERLHELADACLDKIKELNQ